MGLSLLFARRYLKVFGKGELGGPLVPKYLTSAVLMGLWFIYILLSSLQAYGHIPSIWVAIEQATYFLSMLRKLDTNTNHNI